MGFKHYLLSRYNVGIYGRKQKMRSGMKIEPQKWMKNRHELFRKYCAPSVIKQSCDNFKWLIVLDPDTPMRDYLEIWNAARNDAIILYGDNFRKTCVKYIESNLKDESRVITSRCDNDDMLHKNFIANIQSWFGIRKRTGLVTYPKGLVWNPEKQKLRHLRYPKNHFLTFIEKRGPKPVKTVLRARHTQITDMFQTFKVETDSPMWCEIIHPENMANFCRGQKLPMEKLIEEDWGL